MTKTYIAGPMSGIPDHNYPAFHAEAARLRALGHEVVSPAEINDGLEHEGWSACMRRDLIALASCDAIQLLDGHIHSRGATLEVSIAYALGMPVLMPFLIDGEEAAKAP